MNVTKKLDEIKVLEPFRAAIRGWHDADRQGLVDRIAAGQSAINDLERRKVVPRYHPVWYKAWREIQNLELSLYQRFDEQPFVERLRAEQAARELREEIEHLASQYDEIDGHKWRQHFRRVLTGEHDEWLDSVYA